MYKTTTTTKHCIHWSYSLHILTHDTVTLKIKVEIKVTQYGDSLPYGSIWKYIKQYTKIQKLFIYLGEKTIGEYDQISYNYKQGFSTIWIKPGFSI